MVTIKAFFSKIARLAMRFVFTLFLMSLVMVFFLRCIPPVASAFMVGKYCEGLFFSGNRTSIWYDWVDRQHISPHMALAVVAAEDQKFPEHFGFDFQSMVEALKERENGGSLRGASTITQQVAKNLFLWKDKSFIRKGLEAYFTMLMEVLWPKRRILEVYLNIAEFGDGIYGVEAAANRFFHKPPSRLTRRESALLSAVLPNPIRLKAAAPSAYVTRRAQGIERQMRNLGSSYLKDIWSAS